MAGGTPVEGLTWEVDARASADVAADVGDAIIL